MAQRKLAHFGRRKIDELTIEDEPSFRHIALYADLKAILHRDAYSFRTLPDDHASSWDRALFLNLTFWGAQEGGDVLVDANVPADVIAHVAWHHLAAKAFPTPNGARPAVSALFLGEAIASAFDLYLVGRILGHAPKSSFLESQVTAMADAAENAGLDADGFDALLQGVAEDPEGSFASLRELLSDVTAALFASERAEDALSVLTRFESHRFASLLHRYELANWILYARAHGSVEPSPESSVVDHALREATDPLEWLIETWVRPALA